jgi:2-polyprenyl-6-methoxyphenol hydroxylase-like FAD-dependent oxidoreductase
MAPLSILISGAGVAGNALAFWLSRLPADQIGSITIVEKFPALRTTGLQIDLRGAGVTALRRMGLEEGFRAVAAPENGLAWIDKNGKQRAFFGANKSGKGQQGFTSEFEIMRGDLCTLFMEETRDRDESGAINGHEGKRGGRVHYLFGTSIATYVETESGVAVNFENGTSKTYDVVVGADGLGSRVRRLMLTDGKEYKRGNEDPTFRGVGDNFIAYFTIKKDMEPGEGFIAKGYVATKGRFVLVRRHREDTLQVYLMVHAQGAELKACKRGDVAAEKKAMANVFKGAGWIVDELVDAMLDSKDFYCERQGVVKMDHWTSETGRVTLLGDAAHCFSANGHGTTAALVGAYIMAGELGRAVGGKTQVDGLVLSSDGASLLKTAFGNYERILRPGTDKMQKSVENEKNFMPTGEWGIAMLTSVVEIASWLHLDTRLMRFFGEEKAIPLDDYSDVLKA